MDLNAQADALIAAEQVERMGKSPRVRWPFVLALALTLLGALAWVAA